MIHKLCISIWDNLEVIIVQFAVLKLCYLGPISKGWCLQQILPNCNNNLEVFVLTLPINGKAHLSYSLHNFVHISNGFWQNGHHFVKNGMPLENRTPLDSWTEDYHCNTEHVTYSSPYCICIPDTRIRNVWKPDLSSFQKSRTIWSGSLSSRNLLTSRPVLSQMLQEKFPIFRNLRKIAAYLKTIFSKSNQSPFQTGSTFCVTNQSGLKPF